MEACTKVITDDGWNIVQQDSTSLLCKEGNYHITKVTWPITMEVLSEVESPTATTILLRGSNFGWGPIQKNHLRGQLSTLRNKIKLAIISDTTTSSEAASGGIASELEKLADLHARGVLNSDEFVAAKNRLLDNSDKS
jgi:hypothetical protein